jgi:hypothetical protein
VSRTGVAGNGRDQPYGSSNHVTVRSPRRRHPHLVARPATSWSPRPPSSSPPAGTSSGTPGPPQVGNLDTHCTARDLDRDCEHLAGITRPAMPNAVAEYLPARQQHPCSGNRDLARLPRRRGQPAPARPAPQASRSPGPPAQLSPHPPSRPAPPWEITRAAGRTHRDARSTRRPTSSPDTPRNVHRNPVKRLPTPLPGPYARPLYVRGHRNMTVYSVTR